MAVISPARAPIVSDVFVMQRWVYSAAHACHLGLAVGLEYVWPHEFAAGTGSQEFRRGLEFPSFRKFAGLKRHRIVVTY